MWSSKHFSNSSSLKQFNNSIHKLLHQFRHITFYSDFQSAVYYFCSFAVAASLIYVKFSYNKNNTKMRKQNIPNIKIPLSQSQYQQKINYPKQDSKGQKQDQIISLVEQVIKSNGSCDLLQVILDDPLLKELNISLQKQAQQQKKNKLLDSFPFRYRNLVHTEILYKKLEVQFKETQRQIKQKVEQSQEQKQWLRRDIQLLQIQLMKKQQEKDSYLQLHQTEKQKIARQYNSKLSDKDKGILQCYNQLRDVEAKFAKIKTQKQNLNQYLQQIKQECDNLKQENNRIIEALTNKQVEINNLQQTVTEQQQQNQTSKTLYIKQINNIKLNYEQQLNVKINQCQTSSNIIDKYKSQVFVMKRLLSEAEEKLQEMQTRKHNQIQQIRVKLLEQVKYKNSIQDQFERNREQALLQIQEKDEQIAHLEEELIQNKRIINQMAKIHSSNDQMVKINIQKLQSTKNQTIQQIKQELERVKAEKQHYEESLAKSQHEIETIVNNHDNFKVQMETFTKQLIEQTYKNKRTEQKNKQIQEMIGQFKLQLAKYNQLIQEKDSKIQQYRKDIINLRNKQKQLIQEKQTHIKSVSELTQKLKDSNQQLSNLKETLNKYKIKENILNIQIQGYSKLLNKQKCQVETQFEATEEQKQQQCLQLQVMTKQLQRMTLKYQNVCEQVLEYKKQFKQDLADKQQQIVQLQQSNQQLNDIINNKMYQTNQVEMVLDTKIKQLKIFYEQKIEEEINKYKTVIQMLRKQMNQLYGEIDLKKSIEQEMFQQIVKINKDRTSRISQNTI